MRFVLPTFPCYYLAGVWVLRLLTAAVPGAAAPVAGLLAGVVHVVWGVFTVAAETPRQCYSRQALAVLTRELEAQVPRGAVIASSQPVLQHLDFVRLWRCADVSVLRPRGLPGGRRLGTDPGAPAPMQEEKRRIESGKYAGQGPFGRERAIAYDLREWAGDSAVYFVGSEDEMQRLAPSYLGGRYLEVAARIPMPEPPDDERPAAGRRPLADRRLPGGPGPDSLPGLAARPPGPGSAAGFPGGSPGNGPDSPWAARLPRPPGAPGGLMGLSPAIRELLIARWTWQPAGPR
jgi:hypothetical protein